MRHKMRIAILAALMVAGFALAAVGLCACGGNENKAPPAIVKAERSIANDLQRLEAAEPTPTLLDSADRAIQSNWYTAEADPNKIWYVEQLSMTGSVITSFTARGPVEPASDELTNPSQLTCGEGGKENYSCGAIGLAEPNGVYQHPGNEHIARLTDGAMYRFEGDYVQSDQPFTVKTPESISVNGSAPISHTDLSKSEHGTVPPKG